jgi:hypothetical protein
MQNLPENATRWVRLLELNSTPIRKEKRNDRNIICTRARSRNIAGSIPGEVI